jgi:hypothetical protein
MKIQSGFFALSILSATLVVTGPALAATGAVVPDGVITVAEGQEAAGDQPPAIRAMTDGEKAAAGCVVSGAGALAATYAAGPSEVVMLMMGGLVVPSSSAVLFISLIGTMTSVACGAGAAVTPAVLWAWRQTGDVGQQASAIGNRLGTGFADLGSSLGRGFASLAGGDHQVAELPKQAQ